MVFQTSQCPGAPGGHKLLDNPCLSHARASWVQTASTWPTSTPTKNFQILVPFPEYLSSFVSIKYFHPLDVFSGCSWRSHPALSSLSYLLRLYSKNLSTFFEKPFLKTALLVTQYFFLCDLCLVS